MVCLGRYHVTWSILEYLDPDFDNAIGYYFVEEYFSMLLA